MTAEYVNDVAYTRHFLAELSPQHLRMTLALNGVAPPPSRDFDYLEIGCAHGDTLCALAAAHPDGRFLGVDISQLHVTSAKRLARDAALENIGFLERDFADLLEEDIGAFDYVVAYGVLSWISPEKRAALLALARAKLKPGGILFVSYNAMPGWAAVEPLRQLLLSPFGEVAQDPTSLERAEKGLAFAQAMERAGAEYFARNPSASNMLATMTRAGLPYVIHEYLHEHWAPMYFARVAWEMLKEDLHFACVSPLFMNFSETAIPSTLEAIFSKVADRVTYESLRDFAVNEFFRRDLYVKGPIARSPEIARTYLETTAFAETIGAGPADKTVTLPHRTLSLEAPIFEAVLGALGEGATTVRELEARPDLAHHSRGAIASAIRTLVLADRLAPMTRSTRRTNPSLEKRYDIRSTFNQMVLRRVGKEVPLVIASDVAGTGFRISALDGLALRVLTEPRPDARERWIRDFVGRSVMRLRIGDHVIEGDEDQRRALEEAVRASAQRLPKLVELGILTPAED